jgi:hypothetical protein
MASPVSESLKPTMPLVSPLRTSTIRLRGGGSDDDDSGYEADYEEDETKMMEMMITSTEEVMIEKTMMMSQTGLMGMIIGVMLTRASEGVEDSGSRRR